MDNSSNPSHEIEIIAEIGVNHNGNVNLAMELVEAAAAAGADTAKFQVFDTRHLVTKTAGTAAYQRASGHESQYELLKKLELKGEELRRLKLFTESLGMRFLATPDDYPSLRFLVDELGVDRIKIGSGEITNHRFLEQIGQELAPLILSTGMSTLAEIRLAIEALGNPDASQMVLLHCTTSYPTLPSEVNMNAVLTMSSEFGYPGGYSDHTVGQSAALLALGMGCTVFEKHLTLDNKMDGPDHLASADAADFASYAATLRQAAIMLGTGAKVPTATEFRNMPFVRRRAVAAAHLPKGELIGANQVEFLRADEGLMAEEWRQIREPRASRNIPAGTPLTRSDVCNAGGSTDPGVSPECG